MLEEKEDREDVLLDAVTDVLLEEEGNMVVTKGLLLATGTRRLLLKACRAVVDDREEKDAVKAKVMLNSSGLAVVQ